MYRCTPKCDQICRTSLSGGQRVLEGGLGREWACLTLHEMRGYPPENPPLGAQGALGFEIAAATLTQPRRGEWSSLFVRVPRPAQMPLFPRGNGQALGQTPARPLLWAVGFDANKTWFGGGQRNRGGVLPPLGWHAGLWVLPPGARPLDRRGPSTCASGVLGVVERARACAPERHAAQSRWQCCVLSWQPMLGHGQGASRRAWAPC
jgi:hypothetical protein